MKVYGKTFTNPGTSSTTAIDWNGGTGMFAVQGTFADATLTLQHKLGGVWQAIGADATLTESGATLFTTSSTQLQVTETGGTGATITVVVSPVYENKAY